MRSERPFRYTIWGALLSGAGLAVICIFLQYSSWPLEAYFSLPIKFKQLDETHWNASTSSLDPGIYYVSVGRPRGSCELRVNDQLISSTVSPIYNLRGNLLLGGGFSVESSGQETRIGIGCEVSKDGFVTALSHTPVILWYRLGLLLQLWRALTELGIGPFFSIFLFLTLIERRIRKNNQYFQSSWIHFVFAILAFLYSLSLAHVLRFFLEEQTAATLHACLKTAFLWFFYKLSSRYYVENTIINILYFTLIIVFTISGYLIPLEFNRIYINCYSIFALLAFVPVYYLVRIPLFNRSSLLFRDISIMCLLVQLVDLIVIILNRGVHLAPSFVTLMALLMLKLKIDEDLRHEFVDRAKMRLLGLINATSSIEERLKEIGKYILEQTTFRRVSVYLDGFVLGLHDTPLEVFVRLYEWGYKKDTQAHSKIDFRESRGKLMQLALRSGMPQLKKGLIDKAWFVNCPFGSHAILNLSNETSSPDILAFESFELIQQLNPILDQIKPQLVEIGAKMSFVLESLRLIRGDGEWNETIGCIFLDINYYDDHLRKYGESFGRFVSQIYLPAICQRVRKWAVRENAAAGDSVYLICIQDLIQDSSPISEAVYHTVAEIMKFVSHEGAQMCLAHGYEPVQVQLGASSGSATIICDSFQVRTNGSVVNEAARIQKAAPVGGTFGESSLVSSWSQEGVLSFGPELNELVKTKRLLVRRILMKDDS
jgi:hypothetical protein